MNTFRSLWKGLHVAPVLAVCFALGGCVGLLGPDGTEKAIIEKAATMPALTPAEGAQVKSVARNGLFINPSVRHAASLISASADQVRVQRAALFPGLSLAGGGGLGTASAGAPAVQMAGSQLLFDGGNSQRVVQLADFDLQINYINFQKSVDDALVEIVKAYDAVQMQRELLDVYKKQLKAATELDALVANRSRDGAASVSDHLETRKRLQSAAFLVNDAALALGEAQDRLTLLSGQARGGRVKLAARSCKARGETDELRIARMSQARARLELERAERAISPRIALRPILGGELGVNKLPFGVNIDVQSDLLQGGAFTAKANVARNTLAATEAKLAAVRLEDSLGERGLLRALAASDRKTDMLKRQIQLLEKTRGLYRSQYFDMGTRRISELLDNEEEYYSRQAELIQLRSEIALNQAKCAVRSRTLRQEFELEGNSIYGFPLSPDLI